MSIAIQPAKFFKRRLGEKLGQSPMDYVRTRRLAEASTLLKKGIYTVTEVASIIGYGSIGAFSEAFRARYGVSPSELLKRD